MSAGHRHIIESFYWGLGCDLMIGMMMRIYFVDEAASVFEGPPLLDRDRTLDHVTLHCNTVHCTALHCDIQCNIQCSGWLSLAGCLGDPMPPSILATHPLLPPPFVFTFLCLYFVLGICIHIFVFGILCSYF